MTIRLSSLVTACVLSGILAFPRLELVSFLPYNASDPDLVYSTAAINMTVESILDWNATVDIRLKWLYNPSSRPCEEVAGDAVNMVARHFYDHHNATNRCTALIGSKCGLLDVAPIASEWNVPLFDILPNYKVRSHPADFPTVVIPREGYGDLIETIVQIMEVGRWERACLLFDKATAKTATYFFEVHKAFHGADYSLKLDRNLFITFVELNVANIGRDIFLCHTSKPKAILIISDTMTTVEILKKASQFGMGNGETAFVPIAPGEDPVFNRTAFSAELRSVYQNDTILRSVLYVTWMRKVAKFKEENELLMHYAKALFPDINVSVTQPSELLSVWNSYGAIQSWVEFIQTSLDPCNGQSAAIAINALKRDDKNGTLVGGIANIPANWDIWIRVWSPTQQTFMKFMIFNITAKKLQWLTLNVDELPLPFAFALQSCGGSVERGCDKERLFEIPVVLSADAAVLLLLVPLALAVLYRKQKTKELIEKQWHILPSQIHGDSFFGETTKPGVGELNGLPVWGLPIIWNAAKQRRRAEAILPRLLYKLYSINHENVHRFLGMCVTPQCVWIVVPLAKRGTLEMLSKVMELDWNFRLSFTNDILQGLLYIHNSPMEYHGNLSEQTCLIDNRFVVKIACLGFEQIKAVLVPVKRQSFKKLHHSVHQQTDILLFKMIVIGLSKYFPMDMSHLSESDVKKCHAVKKGMEVFTSTADSWHCMDDVEEQFRATFPGERKNPVESVLERLEAYTETMEKAVHSRTEELNAEQERCNQLLEEMLPRPVVEALRSNIYVAPELFECVSICFTDMPGSVNWIATVSASKVVNLLHSIYLLFDEEICKFDVHKIETIGDTYMVASGIPIRNGIDHVPAICRLARSMMTRFETVCMPKGANMKLRAGIHSGPCAAGVVGQLLPRYCLFGDAINTSSRMTSHGDPGRIHASEDTVQLIPKDAVDITYIPRGHIYIKGKGEMSTYWII